MFHFRCRILTEGNFVWPFPPVTGVVPLTPAAAACDTGSGERAGEASKGRNKKASGRRIYRSYHALNQPARQPIKALVAAETMTTLENILVKTFGYAQ